MSGTQTIAASIRPRGVVATSLGMKLLMAVTGLAFVGYAIGHLIGNLQIFISQDAINSYAVFLHSLGPLLWIVRALLLGFFLIHVWMGLKLYFQNSAARPVSYAKQDTVQASVSSRTMIFSGLGLLLYIVYHVMHFTLILTNPEYEGLRDSHGHMDVYSMVILGFQNYTISAVYIVAMVALAFHISHAVPSVFQTLGLNSEAWTRRLQMAGTILAIGLFIGYASIPVAILSGCVTLPGGGH